MGPWADEWPTSAGPTKTGEREIAILKRKFRCNDPLGWKYTDKHEERGRRRVSWVSLAS
jgi:hypothetical protein